MFFIHQASIKFVFPERNTPDARALERKLGFTHHIGERFGQKLVAIKHRQNNASFYLSSCIKRPMAGIQLKAK